MPPCRCAGKTTAARKPRLRDPETGDVVAADDEAAAPPAPQGARSRSGTQQRASRMRAWSAVSGMATKEMYYSLLKRR